MNVRTLGACGALIVVSAVAADWQLSRLETSRPPAVKASIIPPAIRSGARAIKSRIIEVYRSCRFAKSGWAFMPTGQEGGGPRRCAKTGLVC